MHTTFCFQTIHYLNWWYTSKFAITTHRRVTCQGDISSLPCTVLCTAQWQSSASSYWISSSLNTDECADLCANHTFIKWQSWNSNPELSGSRFPFYLYLSQFSFIINKILWMLCVFTHINIWEHPAGWTYFCSYVYVFRAVKLVLD